MIYFFVYIFLVLARKQPWISDTELSLIREWKVSFTSTFADINFLLQISWWLLERVANVQPKSQPSYLKHMVTAWVVKPDFPLHLNCLLNPILQSLRPMIYHDKGFVKPPQICQTPNKICCASKFRDRYRQIYLPVFSILMFKNYCGKIFNSKSIVFLFSILSFIID